MNLLEVLGKLRRKNVGDWYGNCCGRRLFCHEVGVPRRTYSTEYGPEEVIDIVDPYNHDPIGHEKEEFCITLQGVKWSVKRNLYRSRPVTKRGFFGGQSEEVYKGGSRKMIHTFDIQLFVSPTGSGELIGQSHEGSLPVLDDFYNSLKNSPRGYSSAVLDAINNL